MPPLTVTGTLAFCDIVGFTRFTAERGDDAAVSLLERHETIVRDALPSCGRVVKQLGDGLLMFFEDVCAALDTLTLLARQCSGEATFDSPLWVRTGAHHGTPRVRGDDLLGHDVNLTSRIADVAAAGEVLVSEAVLRAAGPLSLSRLRTDEIGPVFVKGLDEPVRLFRVEQA